MLLLDVDDLSPEAVTALFARAEEIRAAGGRRHAPGSVGTAALLFLAPSLRTRVGFAAAARMIGLDVVLIDELRWEPGMTQPESVGDTLRVVSGMVDVVVSRTPSELDRAMVRSACTVPFVNGGDGWNAHPTQALIDLHAMTLMRGRVEDQRIGIVGDLRMHVSRSLIRLFEWFPPRELRLVSPPGRDDPGLAMSGALKARVARRGAWDVEGLDVVYLAGLPEGAGPGRLRGPERAAFALTAARAQELSDETVVLCPLPRIDEIDDEALYHPSVRVFEQSDLGVAVRAAVLEHALAGGF